MDKLSENHNIIKKKGKYSKYPMEKNGIPFYLLIEHGEDGNIKQLFEKPNYKLMNINNRDSLLVSGAHIIPFNPERNHVDFYKNGEKVEVEKTPNQTFQYWISGGNFGI
jgi:hypothetical protein